MSPRSASRPVRMFRRTNGGFVLQDGERELDLSQHLARHELPADLASLFATGFFERASLRRLIDAPEWKRAEPLLAVDVPIPPRSVGKILALGKNYREHAAEFGEAVPEEPLFFNKLPETLVAHGATVRVPAWYCARVDHEVELAVVIGKQGTQIGAADAMAHVAGYSVANDLTARTLQKEDRERKHPWFRAKNLDGFCPLGPCFVPRDELDVADLRVTARVQGELRQDASTRDLVIDVAHAIEWLSRHLTLHPCDIVLMGTPAGVGALEDRDVVECEIEGIGKLVTRIARPASG